MALALSQEEIVLAVGIAIFARTGLYFYQKYQEKKGLGEEIKFESKYLVTGIFAAVLSFFIASISTEPVLAQIPNAEQYSANGLFILIMGTAFSINEIANKVISALGLDRILASNALRIKFNNLNRILKEPTELEKDLEVLNGNLNKQSGNILINSNDLKYEYHDGKVNTNMNEEQLQEQELKLGIILPRPPVSDNNNNNNLPPQPQ